MSARAIGLLGGSFDPVHQGHITMAERARVQLALQTVWLLPASVPPHKPQQRLADAADRLAMLQLAIAGQPGLALCTLELDTPGVHYSVDSVIELQRRHPDAAFSFIMGEDALLDLPQWRTPERLLRLAAPVIAPRGAAQAHPDSAYGVPLRWLAGAPIAISSSAVRDALARGERPPAVAPAVLDYIERHGLYRAAKPA